MNPKHYVWPFDGGSYFDEVRAGMKHLVADSRTIFVGQSVRYESNALYRTMQDEDGTLIVPLDQRIELPVIEDFQLGLCTGMALQGFVPVSIFPRWDFLLLATNQLVLHLDKLAACFDAKVIIRTTVGASHPFSSGPQQSGDYSAAFRLMLKRVDVIELNSRFEVLAGYKRALAMNGSCIIVERQDLYNA